jgi:hypothetical protein
MERSAKHPVLHKYHKHTVHKNTRNILSIIFDEMNCCDEGLFGHKKTPVSPHKDLMHFTAKQSYDIFTKDS